MAVGVVLSILLQPTEKTWADFIGDLEGDRIIRVLTAPSYLEYTRKAESGSFAQIFRVEYPEGRTGSEIPTEIAGHIETHAGNGRAMQPSTEPRHVVEWIAVVPGRPGWAILQNVYLLLPTVGMGMLGVILLRGLRRPGPHA